MVELGPLEQRVLELLWRRTRALSVREAQAALGGEFAYTTVMTTLDRLYKKGMLDRARDGRAYRYSPRTSAEGFAVARLRGWLERLLGHRSARPLLSTFVDAVSEHDQELLPELERLVREKERALRRRSK